MLILISILAFTSTLLGGIFALKFKDRLHLILGFSAGAVIGVAFFDLLPEAIELASPFFEISTITSISALGFICYMILDRFILVHGHAEEHHEHGHASGLLNRGLFGAGSLSIHSFLDGIAIGFAFQVSSAVGIVVTIAVLIHDFSDGINTVNMILKNNGSVKNAFKWLVVDATAPVLGIIFTSFFTLEQKFIGILLAIFCGFFLYLGASDLLPESHHSHPTIWTSLMTVFGIAVLFVAIKLAGI